MVGLLDFAEARQVPTIRMDKQMRASAPGIRGRAALVDSTVGNRNAGNVPRPLVTL